MNLEKQINNNYYTEGLQIEKKQLHNLKKEISKMKKSKREISKEIEKERKKREKQVKNTMIFFDNVTSYLRKCISTSGETYAFEYFYDSRSDKYSVEPRFWPNFIDLNLLHSLCYSKGIILYIEYNNEEKTARMRFRVIPNKKLSSSEYLQLTIKNLQEMHFFQQSLLFNDMLLTEKNEITSCHNK